jgi:hypothetical protein
MRAMGRGAIVIGIAVAIGLLAWGLYPTELRSSADPDFVDNVFDNRGVLWAARLLLVSAAGVLAVGGAFIVLSIGMRMKNASGCGGPARSRSRREGWSKQPVKPDFGDESHSQATRKLEA